MRVALYTSAWIEIMRYQQLIRPHLVALYTSAWIEITLRLMSSIAAFGRTLHECVD